MAITDFPFVLLLFNESYLNGRTQARNGLSNYVRNMSAPLRCESLTIIGSCNNTFFNLFAELDS